MPCKTSARTQTTAAKVIAIPDALFQFFPSAGLPERERNHPKTVESTSSFNESASPASRQDFPSSGFFLWSARKTQLLFTPHQFLKRVFSRAARRVFSQSPAKPLNVPRPFIQRQCWFVSCGYTLYLNLCMQVCFYHFQRRQPAAPLSSALAGCWTRWCGK